MLHQLTIPRRTSVETALDHQQLFTVGLQHVKRLTGCIWTDYNVHDPGITTLELLCYALTDLSYRASFPVKDLLASPSDNAVNMKRQFFTARQILPNRSLTLLDYRKLLIDLKEVRNAWLRPAKLTYYADTVKGELLREKPNLPGIVEVPIAGLYDVLIDYDAGADETAVLKKIKERLHANRNLCEDFVGFTKVDEQAFNLCCELELSPDAETPQVKAEILFQVQEYLAPTVRNYTLTEMLGRRKPDGSAYTADEIFDGPVLDCGFIDDAELEKAELRSEIRLSDIISIIMDIKGVLAIRDIVINPQDPQGTGTVTAPENKWIIPVEPRKKAKLDRERSRLVFYKRNMPVPPDEAQVKIYHKALVAAAKTKAETMIPYDLPIPLGTYRHPGTYYSFQNHFPALYGLSDVGLSSTGDVQDDKTRKALVDQLKAYLLFCDQVMADYFAQVNHVKELFSTDPHLRHTYFHQVVDSVADYHRIYKVAGDTEEEIRTEIATLLDNMDDSSVSIDRRNRFLDHLIARFAERFSEFAQLMYAAFGSAPEDMAALKCEFLDHYPGISSERAVAYNYTLKDDKDLWNTDNVSGLEKRLARLLGIRNFTRRNLGDIAYDVYAEVDRTPDDEFRFRIRKRDTGEILLSSSTKYATPDLAREEMGRAIHAALLPSGYDRKITTGGKHYFNIVDSTGEVIARRIEYFDTETEMEQAIREVMEYLRVNYSDEGMYLIENILLRPEQKTDRFLPICPAPGAPDGVEVDPYSYRIHIILPAYGGRFENVDFRRFAEEVIREETPAHILPKICWISKEQMAVLEKQYRDWVYLKSGAQMAGRKAKLDAFIDILFAVRNVYPEERLRPCAAGKEQPKFILGQTALGTMKEGET